MARTGPTTADGSLARSLGLGDAVVIGLASMIGAGVFAVWAPAASAAGTGLLLGLCLASPGQAIETLLWERLPLAVPLVVGQERVLFIDRNVRIGVPPGVAGQLRVQSAGGAMQRGMMQGGMRPDAAMPMSGKGR